MNFHLKLLIPLTFVSLLSADTLKITFGIMPDTKSKLLMVAQAYIDEINRRSSDELHLEMIYRPWARAIENLCLGETDGDLARDAFVYEGCDSVVVVPVPISSFGTHAFAKSNYFDTVDTQPNRNTRYVAALGNMTSTHWLDSNKLSYITVNHFHQALEMINIGRADCLIANDVFIQDTLFNHYGIVSGDSTLRHNKQYLFLDYSQSDHIPELTDIIEDMRRDNFLEKILNAD